MPTPKYEVRLRKFDCHPETCCHEDHSPWWIWDLRSNYWYLGFDSKTDAIDYCLKMGHTYRTEEDCRPLPDWF